MYLSVYFCVFDYMSVIVYVYAYVFCVYVCVAMYMGDYVHGNVCVTNFQCLSCSVCECVYVCKSEWYLILCLFESMLLCVCWYVYICIYLYVIIYICVCVSICMCVGVYLWLKSCISVWVYIRLYVVVHMYICVLFLWICACFSICV